MAARQIELEGTAGQHALDNPMRLDIIHSLLLPVRK
jgi:hypothetical protein